MGLVASADIQLGHYFVLNSQSQVQKQAAYDRSFLYLRDGTGHASYTYGYLCLNCECLKDRTMSSSVGCT